MTKTRADGEGSIYQSGSVWIAQIYVRDPATGSRKPVRRKRSTKAAAKLELDEMKSRAQSGRPIRDSAATLTSYSQRWESTVLAASTRRSTTKSTYSTLLKTCVRPYLGGLPLAEVRASDIEGWLHDLDGKGLSASTRRQSLTVLRACLDSAVRDGLLAANPAALVSRPVVAREEAHHYTPDQVAALLQAAGDHRLRPMLVMMLGTGLRRGEALALKWEHIDLDRGELRVRGTLVRTEAGLVIHAPKTPKGWRTVPLSLPVGDALRAQRRAQSADRIAAGPSWIDTGHVYCTEAGTPLDPRNTGRWFSKLASTAGASYIVHLRGEGTEVAVMLDPSLGVVEVLDPAPADHPGSSLVRGAGAAKAAAAALEVVSGAVLRVESYGGVGGSLHALRHTALTSMALAGVPLPVLSRVAGHESITTTIDLYGHVSDQAARDAVAAAAAGLRLA